MHPQLHSLALLQENWEKPTNPTIFSPTAGNIFLLHLIKTGSPFQSIPFPPTPVVN